MLKRDIHSSIITTGERYTWSTFPFYFRNEEHMFRREIARTVHVKKLPGIRFASDTKALVLSHRSTEYPNNFANMKSFLYLCFFNLIICTYTIPAKSEYNSILIIFIVNFFYSNILSISSHSVRIPIL